LAINQIILVLSFDNRLSRDIRDYLKKLSYIFKPKEFISNLIVIFTHYPKDPDDDDINISNKKKIDITNILNQIFGSLENLTEIPVYFLNTKIIKKDGKASFNIGSQLTLIHLLSKLKLRLNSQFNSSKINTTNLNYIPNNNGNNIRSELNKIQIIRKKYINLMQTTFLLTQVKTKKHIHGVVLLYSNFIWVCNICGLSKYTSESKYHCSLCDFNICNNCIETKI